MPNPNKRVFYACEAVAIGKIDPTSGAASDLEFVHGVQSVGMNTNFNVEAIFELGQSAPYDQVETNPEIEFTIEKVIDGYPFIYHMATSGATSNNLEARLKQRCNVAMAIGSDENLAISGGPGVPTVEIYMSGMYVNGMTYTFSADGNATESVTLVGNNKVWNASTPFENTTAGHKAGAMTGWTSTVVNAIDDRISPARTFNEDYPIGSGGIVRREDVIMESSIMPVSIFGVNGTGVGNNWDSGAGAPRAHITNVTISMGDAGREDIYELGSKDPYFKTAAGSKEITAEIEVATVSGDFLGIVSNKDTSPPQPIKVVLRNGATFDLGAKNKVTAVSYGGGEAGGGNLTITYSFTTQNDLTITQPNLFNILS
jgi:hypothetical protein